MQMDEGSAATGSEGGSSAAVQDPRGGAEMGSRMALLANTAGFMCHMLLQHQPMAYRSSIVSCMTSHNWSHLKARRSCLCFSTLRFFISFTGHCPWQIKGQPPVPTFSVVKSSSTTHNSCI